MLYTILKHSHMTIALISLIGFLLRAYFSFYRPELLKVKIIKIAPHVIDTLLLIMGVSLLFITGYGFQGWVVAKIIAIFFYIGFAVVVIKRIGSPSIRIAALLLSLISYAAAISFVVTKQALWFI